MTKIRANKKRPYEPVIACNDLLANYHHERFKI